MIFYLRLQFQLHFHLDLLFYRCSSSSTTTVMIDEDDDDDDGQLSKVIVVRRNICSTINNSKTILHKSSVRPNYFYFPLGITMFIFSI